MKKSIVIVGGGISGLALLHYLKLKYPNHPDVHIRLLEKNKEVGGTATTFEEEDFLFESGPNGFLDHNSDALSLSQELGLGSELVYADDSAKKRYILFNNRLELIPSSFLSLLKFRPFSLRDKLRLPFEIMVKPGTNPSESVYGFGARRFGEKFSKIFLEAMVLGIYAGDARKINLKEAFPKIFEMEQNYGSCIKAAFELKKQRKSQGLNRPKLVSFLRGMSQLCEALRQRYSSCIQVNESVESIESNSGGLVVKTAMASYPADEVFVCTPAYVSARLLEGLNKKLSDSLSKIDYAPVAVVGLLYDRKAFASLPEGFGYLIPTHFDKSILGVLFESNIFPARTSSDKVLVRVMIGGALHRDVVQKKEQELIALAQGEIHSRFFPKSAPIKSRCVVWHKGIPQYDNDYVSIKQSIQQELSTQKHLHLLGNYLNGVAFNDCVANAKRASLDI